MSKGSSRRQAEALSCLAETCGILIKSTDNPNEKTDLNVNSAAMKLGNLVQRTYCSDGYEFLYFNFLILLRRSIILKTTLI